MDLKFKKDFFLIFYLIDFKKSYNPVYDLFLYYLKFIEIFKILNNKKKDPLYYYYYNFFVNEFFNFFINLQYKIENKNFILINNYDNEINLSLDYSFFLFLNKNNFSFSSNYKIQILKNKNPFFNLILFKKKEKSIEKQIIEKNINNILINKNLKIEDKLEFIKYKIEIMDYSFVDILSISNLDFLFKKTILKKKHIFNLYLLTNDVLEKKMIIDIINFEKKDLYVNLNYFLKKEKDMYHLFLNYCSYVKYKK